jgi:hypothetical protein
MFKFKLLLLIFFFAACHDKKENNKDIIIPEFEKSIDGRDPLKEALEKYYKERGEYNCLVSGIENNQECIRLILEDYFNFYAPKCEFENFRYKLRSVFTWHVMFDKKINNNTITGNLVEVTIMEVTNQYNIKFLEGNPIWNCK